MSAILSEALKITGCFCPPDRAIGLPFEYEPPIHLGNGVGKNCSFSAFSYTYSIISNFHMGRYCSIAHNVEILGNHTTNWLSTHPFTSVNIFSDVWVSKIKPDASEPEKITFKSKEPAEPIKPVTLGHDVWIGAGVKFIESINVGTGAIIAAGAIVTKDVPPYAIVGGVPAKFIRWRFPEALRERLLASQWWRYNVTGLELDFSNPDLALDQLQELIEKQKIYPWEPSWKRLGADLKIESFVNKNVQP